MEHVWKVYICWSEIWEYVVNFCNEYASIATILSVIITICGACGIKQFIQKCKKRIEFNNQYLGPVKNRFASAQIDAYINATDNGVSEIEVKEEVDENE